MLKVQTLKGKIALVTGGAKGYGRGIAKKLKEKGCEVWITGRDETALTRAEKELGVHFLKADVTSPTDWSTVETALLRQSGGLDIMVNNAGEGGAIAELDQQTVESIRSCIDINLTGSILGCRMAAGIMKKRKSGTIINISSICSREAWPGWGVYSAAKSGLEQMSECLYVELRPYGVRVTNLIPSWGATGFQARSHLPVDEDARRKSIQPEELGDQVTHICELPDHLAILTMTILPLVQEINPL